MARQAKTIPKPWKDIGVWVVVNVDGQWDLVDEYDALEARVERQERLSERETSRRVELRQAMQDLFVAKVLPYSGDEYAKLQSSRIAGAIDFRVGSDGKARLKQADPNAVATDLAIDIIEKRVLEFKNYTKTEYELGPDQRPVFDLATHQPKVKVVGEFVNGADLAAFVRSPEAWESERLVVDDLFASIRDRSHLEAGMGKASASRRDFSPADTRR